MRYLTALALFAFMLVCVSSAFAGAKADSIALQGRLTDASDNPVADGPKDLILSLWTDSVGGTMLHSEVVVVTVSKGLYSTCIGCASSSFFDVFTDLSVYLETQLAGSPPMTPRTPLRSVPFSVSSSGVHSSSTNGLAKARGMVITKPGSIKPHATMRLENDDDGDGKPEFAIIDSTGADHSVVLIGHDFEDDGILDNTVSSSVTPTNARLAIKTKGTSAQRYSAGGDCDDSDAMLFADCDDDNDGVVDREAALRITPTTSSLAIKTKGTSAQRLRAGGDCDDSDSRLFADCDDDNDGVVDREAALRITPTTSSLAIKTKGTGAQRFSGGTDCDDTDVRDYLDSDDDGDGIPEVFVSRSSSPDSGKMAMSAMKLVGGMPNRISMNVTIARQTQTGRMGIGQDNNSDEDEDCDGYFTVTPTTSSVAINTKGTGADKGRSAGSNCDDSSAVDYLDIDDDGDGILEAHAVSSVSSIAGGGGGGGAASAAYAATGRWYTDSDDDGFPEGDISNSVTPGTCSVAIKTKGTGADPNRVVSSTTTDTAAAITRLAADLNNDSIDDVVLIGEASSSRTKLEGHFQAGDTPSQADFSSTLDSDAGRHLLEYIAVDAWSSSVESRCTPDSVTHEITMTDPSGATGMKVKEKANRTKCTSNLRVFTATTSTGKDDDCDGISSRSAWTSSGGGTNDSITITASSGVDPILHSSGAKLTVGGTWTNSSDANLKENFQPVDGAELLQKIEELPINQWNYKSESDEVTHIGPTAQDFQKVFGIGENDKTISTIDPSGIALAAIKELKKENTELKKQVEALSSLKAEVEQLKKILMEKK